MNYTFQNFPSWLKNGSVFKNLNLERNYDLENDDIVPFPNSFIINSFEIESTRDFINVFKASNFFDLFKYPVSVYLYSLLYRDEVFNILDEIDDNYSSLYKKDLEGYKSILKYKNEILEYASFLGFIELEILEELRQSLNYCIKIENIIDENIKYMYDEKYKTYEEYKYPSLELKINLSIDDVIIFTDKYSIEKFKFIESYKFPPDEEIIKDYEYRWVDNIFRHLSNPLEVKKFKKALNNNDEYFLSPFATVNGKLFIGFNDYYDQIDGSNYQFILTDLVKDKFFMDLENELSNSLKFMQQNILPFVYIENMSDFNDYNGYGEELLKPGYRKTKQSMRMFVNENY